MISSLKKSRLPNNNLSELFKQKYLLKMERDKEISKILKSSLWWIVLLSLSNFSALFWKKFCLIRWNISKIYSLFCLGLLFLYAFFCFYCLFLLPPKNFLSSKQENQQNRTENHWGIRQRAIFNYFLSLKFK